MITRKHLPVCIIAILFVLNSLWVWYGFDRLPLVSNSDEVFSNDAAVSLARGQGLAAKSLSGTLNFENTFAHYPPVYPLFQALLFRFFGISAFTLRCANIIFYILSTAGIIFIFFRLFQIGVFKALSFFLITILYLSNPTPFSLARQGRPDSMALFFSTAAFILLFSRTGITLSKKRWVIAAIMMGLSISTHLETTILWVIFGALLIFQFARRSLKFACFLSLLPLFIFAGIWLAAHTTKSYIAALQCYRISSFFLNNSGANLIYLLKGVSNSFLLSLTSLIRGSYWMLILLLFSWLVLLTKAILEVKRKGLNGLSGNKWLINLLYVNLASLVFISFTDISAHRLNAILPLALIGAGVALSNADFRLLNQKMLFAFIIFLALCGLTIKTIYISRASAEWSSRDPSRFSNFVSSLPLKSKVAARFPLWFEFIRQGRTVQVIYLGGLGYFEHYNRHPEDLDNFDRVILFASDTPPPILSSRRKRLLEIGREKFMIFEKQS